MGNVGLWVWRAYLAFQVSWYLYAVWLAFARVGVGFGIAFILIGGPAWCAVWFYLPASLMAALRRSQSSSDQH